MKILHIKKEKTQLSPNVKEDQPTPKITPTLINKVEIINDTLKFSVTKGLISKRWIVVKEIPVLEITRIENFGKELTVAQTDATETFFMKGKAETLGEIRDSINKLLEQRKSQASNEISDQERNELLGVISASISVVDSLFDVLIALQEKRINWQHVENRASSLVENHGYSGQTIPPLNLDFARISSSIKKQLPRETSKEAYNILKTVYTYFNGLNVGDELKESHLNSQNAKTLILAYYTLNDLFLGSAVGDKENKKEKSHLELVLQNLANEIDFKINVDEVTVNIDKMGVESDRESVILASRELFKQQMEQL
jgi:hypothetical protein